MSRFSLILPGQGQGSVVVGMGKEVYEHSEGARKIFFFADNYLFDDLGKWLSEICFSGPDEELFEQAQLAALTVDLAYASARFGPKKNGLDFAKKGKRPSYLAGHSVGYIPALVIAKVITLRQAYEIVKERKRLMDGACKKNPGKMFALLHPKLEEIERVCEEFGIEIANDNSETQIVITGLNDAIDRAVPEIVARKLAAKAIQLKVAGPLHSRWLSEAGKMFAEFLEPIPFADPKIPIIGNTKARVIKTGPAAKREAWEHISRRVEWRKSMEFMVSDGVTVFIETGEGKVLSDNLQRSVLKARIEKIISSSVALADRFKEWSEKKKNKK